MKNKMQYIRKDVEIYEKKLIVIFFIYGHRYDNVTLNPLLLQRGLRFGPIQRNGAAPGVIHTGRFFVLIPLKWFEKLTGMKDTYI